MKFKELFEKEYNIQDDESEVMDLLSNDDDEADVNDLMASDDSEAPVSTEPPKPSSEPTFGQTMAGGAIGAGLGKLIGKAAPGLAVGMAAPSAYQHAKKGDWTGVALDAAAAAAPFVMTPWVGIPVSMAIEYINSTRDENQSSATQNPVQDIQSQLPPLAENGDKDIAVLQYQLSEMGEDIEVDGVISQKLVDILKKLEIKTESIISKYKILSEAGEQDDYFDKIDKFVMNSIANNKVDSKQLSDFISTQFANISQQTKDTLQKYASNRIESVQKLINANKAALKKVGDWIKQHPQQNQSTTQTTVPSEPGTTGTAGMEMKPSNKYDPQVAKMQTVLKDKGYNLGTFGPKKNGVDGVMGDVTITAMKDAGISNSTDQEIAKIQQNPNPSVSSPVASGIKPSAKLSQMEEMELHALASDLEKVVTQHPDIQKSLDIYYQLYGRD